MASTVTAFSLSAVLLGLGLFVGILGTLALGEWIERGRLARGGAQPSVGAGTMNSAVFALLGLLIAFTFSGAAERFEARRALIVHETNAIGTAYLRLDLLLPGARAHLQDEFRRYLDSRLATYRAASIEAFRAGEAHSRDLQAEIWQDAVVGAKEAGMPAIQVLLPALNEVVDITTTRSVALESHPPMAIYGMLIMLALLTALLAGFGLPSSDRSWLAKIAFAGAVSVTIYLTVDIEYPRLGLIRISHADHSLEDLRGSMK